MEPIGEKLERWARMMLRKRFRVEAVPLMQRHQDEFAALVIDHEDPNAYDDVLEFLTRPGCPVEVVREFRGYLDTRIYVQAADHVVWSEGADVRRDLLA